jgi:galactokinase/mevalonate kinase-like predicted kinase
MLEVKVPARINILGNPSDANEGEHQTISAAINIWASASVEPADKIIFEQMKRTGSKFLPAGRMEIDPVPEPKISYGTDYDLLSAALKMMLKASPELREKIKTGGLKISYHTDVPRQSGMGGSTLLAHICLLSLVHFYKLEHKAHNLYFLAELTQRIEEKELGITCGYADRYVPLFGDIAYIDYRGKVFHKTINDEPYCTYEKLGDFVEHPPLVIVYPGVEHNSGDVHKVMRSKYLEERKGHHGEFENGPFMVRIMKLIGDTAWKGKIALLNSDWKTFGSLMNENHKLVNEMMEYCGFKDGAGEADNIIIKLGLELGALGGKLTGAGGGGSVFFLAAPGDEDQLAAELERRLKAMNYGHAEVWVPSVVRQGAVVLDKW